MDLSDYCRQIRAEHPEYVSKEQMRIICHISKRKARWLLVSGLVPCEDNGKQTRNYRIKTDDVIKYLKGKEAQPWKYSRVLPNRKIKFHKDCPDVLTVMEAVRLTGYSKSAVLRWIASGRLEGFKVKGAYRVTKEGLEKFLTGV